MSATTNQKPSDKSEGVAGIGCTVGLGDGFPDKAQNLLNAFYVATGANNERTKIGALRRGFDLEDAIITTEDELKGLEFYVLTKLKII